MPIGVMIYDVEAKSIYFENQQFKKMVEVDGGKQNCLLKTYA